MNVIEVKKVLPAQLVEVGAKAHRRHKRRKQFIMDDERVRESLEMRKTVRTRGTAFEFVSRPENSTVGKDAKSVSLRLKRLAGKGEA